MKTKTLRIPDELQQAITMIEEHEHIEESTAMRKLLQMGYESFVAGLYERGDVTLGQAASFLRRSRPDVLDLFLQKGVRGNLRAEDVVASLASLGAP